MKLSNKLFKRRNWLQGLATLATNPHVGNFASGKLYTGSLKRACVPGLNCYSCPAATGACPVGAFQAVVGSSSFKFSYYITGILILIGVMLGRFVCGFLCPFGWFQDLLHKLPTPKFSTKKLKALTYLKYIIMIVVVWLLGVFIVDETGMSMPYFCKYICPQGILEGALPISLVRPSMRTAFGSLFNLKLATLIVVTILSILMYRPFCKWICPLGAFYSLFNKLSFMQLNVSNTCIGCGKCEKICPMDVSIYKGERERECIRCGDCIEACPVDAISSTWSCMNAGGQKNLKECKEGE